MVTNEERWKTKLKIDHIDEFVDRMFPSRSRETLWEKLEGVWIIFRRKLCDLWFNLRSIDERRVNGFARVEVWDFVSHHAEWCLPRLMRFRKHLGGTPIKKPIEQDEDGQVKFLTIEEWQEIIGKMCRAFYLTTKRDEDLYVDADPLTPEYIEEGLDLFARYYLDLWD